MQITKPADLTQAEREKIIHFLKKNPVGVLATTDLAGDPHASTIYFTVDENLRITFTTKHDTYKYKNIAAHNTVMLVVFEAESQTAVQVSGKAIEIKDSKEQQAIYHGTLEAAAQTGEDVVPPVAKIAAGAYVGFAIDIKNIWLSDYGWGNNFANAMKHAKDTDNHNDPA
jgi:general stress protein 26